MKTTKTSNTPGRRENIRIKGIKKTADEDTTAVVVDVARRVGVTLTAADVSVSHRTGTDGEGPIIVRFARREKKIELMKNKKKLPKGDDAIYFEEDLARIHHRMLYEIRKDANTTKTWTINGKIFAMMKENEGEGQNEVKKVFETPDDLYKLGWNEARLTLFLQSCA